MIDNLQQKNDARALLLIQIIEVRNDTFRGTQLRAEALRSS